MPRLALLSLISILSFAESALSAPKVIPASSKALLATIVAAKPEDFNNWNAEKAVKLETIIAKAKKLRQHRVKGAAAALVGLPLALASLGLAAYAGSTYLGAVAFASAPTTEIYPLFSLFMAQGLYYRAAFLSGAAAIGGTLSALSLGISGYLLSNKENALKVILSEYNELSPKRELAI